MAAATAPAVVIGAGGFIGSHFARLLDDNFVRAELFTRQRPFLDGGRLHPALRSARVIHYLASRVNPASAAQQPHRTAEDYRTFGALLTALRSEGCRPTLVLVGSAGHVYDVRSPVPYTEESPLRPTTAYGHTKLALEEMLLSAADAVRPMVLRVANAYGPGQRTGTGQGVIAHWLEAVAAGRPLRVYGDPTVCRDYVYVTDVAEALYRVHLLGCEGCTDDEPLVVNIGSGRPVALMELVGVLGLCVGRDLAVEYEVGRGFDRGSVWFDVSRAADVLDWRPYVPLEQGIGLSWEALRPVRATHRSAVSPRIS